MTKRYIKIKGLGIIMEISKVTSVRTDKEMLHFDRLRDGTWRIIYNENMIPDFTKIESFEIIRKD